MSWEDLITHVMSTTSKVEQMAVYDLRGRPVAVTEGLETSDTEGRAVVNCLRDHAKTLTKLHVGDEDFVCVPGINDTFIGTSPRQASLVIVGQRHSDHVVAVVGLTTGRGSFIFELKQSLTLMSQGRLITQQPIQQPQQQHRLLPVDDDVTTLGADVTADESAGCHDDVLVEMDQSTQSALVV